MLIFDALAQGNAYTTDKIFYAIEIYAVMSLRVHRNIYICCSESYLETSIWSAIIWIIFQHHFDLRVFGIESNPFTGNKSAENRLCFLYINTSAANV